MKLRRQVRPPENVRAVMRDGSEVPVECAYVGKRDGFHVWEAVWTLPQVPARVTVDVLPARSQVTVRAVTQK